MPGAEKGPHVGRAAAASIPRAARVDALHVASAAIGGVSYLLS